jgi:hypothetical protein
MSTSIGVIEQFLHPPIGTVRREHIPTYPSSSSQSLQRIRGTRFVDAYGIQVIVSNAAPGYGFVDDATGVTFERTVWKADVFHLLIDNAAIRTQTFDTKRGSIYFLFNESFPYVLHMVPSPGIELDAWWLLRLFP